MPTEEPVTGGPTEPVPREEVQQAREDVVERAEKSALEQFHEAGHKSGTSAIWNALMGGTGPGEGVLKPEFVKKMAHQYLYQREHDHETDRMV